MNALAAALAVFLYSPAFAAPKMGELRIAETKPEAASVDGRPGKVFKGENCAACHAAIRDRQPAGLGKGKAVKKGEFDVIVVGGGMAGLIAAHELGDLKVLVLDKEAKAGGKMRRETFDKHPYPVGGIYMGEPYGKIDAIFKSLGLTYEKIVLPDHSMTIKGKIIDDWLTGDPARLPYSRDTQKKFKEFQAAAQKAGGSPKLVLPIEQSDKAYIEELDKESTYAWTERQFGPEVAGLADLYCKNIFGVSGKEVSAAAGLMYIAAEFSPAYMWEGGLGRISEALAEKLGPTVSTGSFVWNVEPVKDGVVVRWHDWNRDYEAKAKTVVMAVPAMIGKRIIKGLSDEKHLHLSKVRYSSYALVPMKMKKVVWGGSLVLWAPGKFFTDLTMPRPTAPDPKADGQTLMASIPMGESEGRAELLATPDDLMIARVLIDLETVFSGAPSELADVRVIRWGHAMPIAYPGYLTKIRPDVAKPEGRLFFAGVDTQLPALEGAVYSGILAADNIRDFLKVPKKSP